MFEVIGKSSVVVIDARHALIDKPAPGQPLSGTGVILAVLRAGQSDTLAQ